MNRYLHLILISAVLISSGCKEVYSPVVDETQQMLVVEGLLTDESNVITVKLSNTTAFKDQTNLPEVWANVFVTDDKGRKFHLGERKPGIYTSENFHYEYGRTYTLFIRTRDDNFYKSSQQTLFNKSEMAPVNSVIKTNTFEINTDNNPVLKTIPGIEISTTLNANSESSPFYRFSNNVLVEYTETVKFYQKSTQVESGFFYSWKKYLPDQFFNLNDNKIIHSDTYNHVLAFCPIDTSYLGIVDDVLWEGDFLYLHDRNIYYYAVTVKRYHLNKDVYQYYKDINTQLEAHNRFFDPVSFQVRGNIICENNPEEHVLGVFEVSSTSIRTYSFSDFLPDKTVKFNEMDTLDIEGLPVTGSSHTYPSFWVFDH